MKFNKLQSKLWAKMLELISIYRKGDLQYSDFVYELEGCLDAGNYQDNELVGSWYDHWTPLEILCATKGDSTTFKDADKYLTEMEIFLNRKFNSVRS